MTTFKPWEYRADAGFVKGTDLTGYTVVAVDGDIGHVEAEYDGRPAYLDVDVGSWLFGHHVTLPVGLVERIDARRDIRLTVFRRPAGPQPTSALQVPQLGGCWQGCPLPRWRHR